MTGDREHARIPYTVEMAFRTASSFLVAYSVNLSKGGVFLETSELLPVGTEVTLRFAIPDAGTFELPGVVSWVRDQLDARTDGPVGIAVAFERIEDHLGSAIDNLVASFTGVTILLFSDDDEHRSAIARMVRSIIATADVVEASAHSTAEALLGDELDLVLIDSDSEQGAGPIVLRASKQLPQPLPAVVLASDQSAREHARELGADEVLDNPAHMNDLQRALLRALGRPATVR